MSELTPQGRALIEDLARQYGVTADAVETMARAVSAGGGTMAQFYHPDFGGGGQWMTGGMTMVGDMFNYGLKSKVEGVCSALAGAMANGMQIFVPRPAPSHNVSYQSQGGGGSWWPSELGSPSSTGSQNSMRYAYFPGTRRLAIDDGGQVRVYDTLDHQIGGFGQQQGGGASFTFSSQYGVVPVDSLPRVDGGKPAEPAVQAKSEPIAHETQYPAEAVQQSQTPVSRQSHDEIFSSLERLKGLADKGVITEAEYQAKKSELLSRL